MKRNIKNISVIVISCLFVFFNMTDCFAIKTSLLISNRIIKEKLEKTTIYNVFPSNRNLIWLTGDFSNDLSFDNSQAVVFKSIDGGTTWEKNFSIKDALFLKIYFTNETDGFLIGGFKEEGCVWKTGDGGKSWELLKIKTDDFLFDVQFINQKVGWILGKEGSVYFTFDGGKSWEYRKISNSKELKSFSFKNELEGWAFGNQGKVYTTVDGGKTWIGQEQYFNLTVCADKQNLDFKTSVFLNENEGFAVARCKINVAENNSKRASDKGIIFTTQNGGKNWESRVLTETLGLESATFTKSGKLGVVPTFSWQKNGVFFYSSDNGQTWKSSSLPNIEGLPSQMFFVDDKVGWLVTNAGFYIDYLYKTEDGGSSWKKIN